MTSSLVCLSHSARPSFRSILRQKKCFYRLDIISSTTESSRKFSSKYYDTKYNGIRNRLTSIPCLNLLNKEVDGFKRDLCYEDDKQLDDLGKWNSKVFEHNSGVTSLLTAEFFLKAYCVYGFSLVDATWNQWDSDRWKSAAILAWCIETTSRHTTIFDDIMDQSVQRRRNLSWYKKPEIGLSAVFDASMLQWSIYKVLRKHFVESKCYLNLLHEFYETNRRIAYGQKLDTHNEANLKSIEENFTFEKYKVYVENKAAQFCYFFPVHLAMHLTGRYSAKESDFMKEICGKIGLILQIQDDSYDFVLPMEITGLKGNDIRNGKITWFAIKFLEDASESMKKQFSENYGVNEDDAVENILELYEKTKIIERFQEFEEQMYTEISTLIESADNNKGALYYDLFHRIQARKEDQQ